MKYIFYTFIAILICTNNINAAGRASVTQNSNRISQSANKNTKQSSQTNRFQNISNRSARTAATQSVSGTQATINQRTIQRQKVLNDAKATRNATVKRTMSRAALLSTTQPSDANYDTCHDAYFTCMDQFCAKQNETYRRCICSAKLTDIKNREHALEQTSTQLQDFHDLNLVAIPKTATEVTAMLNATSGETTQNKTTDKSASAQQLVNISAVLNNTKQKSLSTNGTLDIGGDINSIWSTTDLALGANIADLTGSALYNAVHGQCAELVSSQCPSNTTLNMVISAYGMYIENDCALLFAGLDKKNSAANTAIRETKQAMNTARLENYNAHNATPINDCIANIRKNITADNVCGTDYVHCLDVSGRYLNKITGDPIYTAEFYQLNNQISLQGDILNNKTNRAIVNELNNKKIFATKTLDTCRDLSNDIWDEFTRQAITEIYQKQQEKIRTVKNECLDVVNNCYDEQNQSLKDFSNVDLQQLLGARLELSEQMCQTKLETCSNLYGNGRNGLELLLTEMHNITDQKIAQTCFDSLSDYVKKMCTVPGTDNIHAYPYACRVYAPGEAMYATIPTCNTTLSTNNGTYPQGDVPTNNLLNIISQITNSTTTPRNFSSANYICYAKRNYSRCNPGYYLTNNKCLTCPVGYTCLGGEDSPKEQTCGNNYIGSLYQKLVRYATQSCVRPSSTDDVLPTNILQDINRVITQIRADMSVQLSAECSRLGGEWVNTSQRGNDAILHQHFYDETGANTAWGYCRQITENNSSAQSDNE